MNNNIDNLMDELNDFEKVSASEDFLEKLGNRAVKFTELKVRFGKKMIVAILLLVAGILMINAVNFNYQSSNNPEETNQPKEYDLVPANSVTYE